MFFQVGNGRGGGPPRGVVDTYTQHFAAYPAAFVENSARVDSGGRVLLPANCLAEMATLNLVYPLQFEIKSYAGRSVFAGVLEFEAPGGQVILPRWMFEHLQLSPQDTVRLQSVALPQGTLVKLRPHQRAFVEAISDPKAVLEAHLKNHPVMTRGSTILLHYLNRDFSIDVLDTIDARGKSVKAISTVHHDARDTELKVEFARPLDMPESPVKPPPAAFPTAVQGANVIGGQEGVSFTPLAFKPPSLLPTPDASKNTPTSAEPSKPAFVPFGGGAGRTLSGRPPPPNPAEKQQQGNQSTNDAPGGAAPLQQQGAAQGGDKNSFTAFHGPGRSLR